MSDETIKQANNVLKEFGEKFAEMVLFTQELFKKMTPEQRAVVDFLAENPKVAEAFQELNQKLARQKVIEGATKEAAQPEEPLIRDEKTCKIFRDWCVANGLDDGKFRYYKNGILRSTIDDDFSIWFGRLVLHVRLREGTEYTLAELCGEEKNESL